MELQKTPKTQSKKEKCCRYHALWFKLYYKAMIFKTVCFWPKSWHRDEHTHSQLKYNKETNNTHRDGKTSITGAEKTGQAYIEQKWIALIEHTQRKPRTNWKDNQQIGENVYKSYCLIRE